MIVGRLNQDLDPLVAISIADSRGSFRSLEAVLDTGFGGYLTLPERAIQRLGLELAGERRITLGTGESRMVNAYSAVVSWIEQRRDVIVFESASETLLGMALLRGYRVSLDVREDGEVVVE